MDPINNKKLAYYGKGRNEVINSIKSSFRISVLKFEVLFIQIPMISISSSKQLRKID